MKRGRINKGATRAASNWRLRENGGTEPQTAIDGDAAFTAQNSTLGVKSGTIRKFLIHRVVRSQSPNEKKLQATTETGVVASLNTYSGS